MRGIKANPEDFPKWPTFHKRGRRIHDLSILELSPRLVQASLRMEVLDRASNQLYDFQATYSLAGFSGAWRIVAIAHNQIPPLLKCVTQREAGA